MVLSGNHNEKAQNLDFSPPISSFSSLNCLNGICTYISTHAQPPIHDGDGEHFQCADCRVILRFSIYAYAYMSWVVMVCVCVPENTYPTTDTLTCIHMPNCHKNNKYLICWDYGLTPGKTLKRWCWKWKTYGPLVAFGTYSAVKLRAARVCSCTRDVSRESRLHHTRAHINK